MFTGIIQSTGTIGAITREHGSARVRIECPRLDLGDVASGDSIAVSGPCLTVVSKDGLSFDVEVSSETLECTTLGDKRPSDPVNLEKALRLSDRLGGHLVSGHIDGVGTVADRQEVGEYVQFTLASPAALSKYIATKGSISVDGVSLTVNEVRGDAFDLMIIPHTLEETTLGLLQPGDRVNLEVDQIARYLERLMAGGDDG
jgi:riboflavin synthase